MDEVVEAPAPRPPGHDRWRPSAWSLRTKISIVLLLPVVVALILAAGRIQTELSQASQLSVVRDQVPVMTGIVQLGDLVDQEMIAAVTTPDSVAVGARVAATDAAAATVQQDAQFGNLAADSGKDLSNTLGRLAGLRTAGTSGTTGNLAAVNTANGYHDIVFALSQVVPTVVSPAGLTDLDDTATAVEALIQLRTDLAVEEALLSDTPSGDNANDVVVAANRAATEEGVLVGQIKRTMPAALATAFDQATSSTTNRQNALLNVQATGDTDQLTELVAPLQIESTTLGNLMNDLVGTLSNRVGTLTDQARSDALRDSALVLGALLAAVGIALYVARSLVFPMRILHAAAVDAATNRLPDTIRQVRTGRHVDWRSVEPVPVRTTEEIGQLARAFDEMHRQAVRLAGEQAELRGQVSEMFMTLARRSQSLVELQLSVIEDLETDEQDPQRLDDLFRIDHIATRLRRNGENLQVLAGGSPSRPDDGPVTMIELLRAATSEVKDYRRIALGNAPSGLVRAQAAADVVHILAELLENATRFSPPQDKVVLTADRGADGGVLIEVVDTGLGMAADDLDAANTRLAAGDSVSPETTRRMGLFVVGRLAAPHGVTVKLRRTTTRVTQAGITASVHVPGALVIAEALPNSPLSRPGRAAAQELMSGSRPALPGVPFNPAGPAATTGSMVPINGNLTGPANGDHPVNGGHPANGPMTGPLNGMANGAVNGGVNGVAHNPGPGPHRTMPASSEPAWPRNEPSPIFDQMITGWFMEDPHHPNQQPRKPQPPPPAAQTPRNSAPPPRRDPWAGPADVARRAAEEAVGHAKHSAVTPKGLPVRRPGAQLAPGTANPTGKPAAGRQGNPADFRDPAAVRNNLARHYSGMRAARQRTQGDAESSMEGKADPK